MGRSRKKLVLAGIVFIMCFYFAGAKNVNANDNIKHTTQLSNGEEISYYLDDSRSYAYTLNDDDAILIQCNKAKDKTVMPSEIDGHKVTVLGYKNMEVFTDSSKVKELTVPDTVTKIGKYAFADNSNLRQVKLGTNVKSVMDYAFSECPQLLCISIPANVTAIGKDIFMKSPQVTVYTAKDSTVYTYMKSHNVPVSTAAMPSYTELITAPNAKVSTATATSLTLKWGKIEGASKYEIYRSTKAEKGFKKIATIAGNKTSYTNKNLKEKTTYYYKLRTCKKVDGKNKYSRFGWTFAKMKLRINGNSKAFGGTFSKTEASQIENAAVQCYSMYSDLATDDYSKACVAQIYLNNNVSYSMKSKRFYDAWGALVNKKASCYGYSFAYVALCNEMGLKAQVVYANKASANPNHMWVMVNVKGNWYIVDPQANDLGFGFVYFLMSSKSYKQATGMAWDTGKYPKCNKDW